MSFLNPGYFLLLDFANDRMVDHVRILEESDAPESRVALRMQK